MRRTVVALLDITTRDRIFLHPNLFTDFWLSLAIYYYSSIDNQCCSGNFDFSVSRGNIDQLCVDKQQIILVLPNVALSHSHFIIAKCLRYNKYN